MPSETTEPTQEQRARADAVVDHRNRMFREHASWGSDGDEADLIAAALAAEAAPLREEIERLTKERDEARRRVSEMEPRLNRIDGYIASRRPKGGGHR